MLRYLQQYCDYFDYKIIDKLIYSSDSVIGHINFKEKHVTIGSNKLKYGDFAVLVMEGYFDILGENNDSL